MPEPRRWRIGGGALWRLAGLVAFVVASTLVAVAVPLPALVTLRTAVDSAGAIGVIGFVLGYAATTLAPVPKAVLSILAGLVWGFWAAAIVVYIGALLGAGCAFLLGRWLGRDAIERFTGTRVARVDDLLRRRGFLAVLGVRLVPVIPFTAINYIAGLTAVRRRDYALGTAVGIIPGDVAYVAIGAYGLQLGWEFWAAAGSLGLLTIGGALVGIRARRRSETTADRKTRDDDV